MDPDCKIWLIIRVIDVEIDEIVSLSHLVLISLGPDDFLGLSDVTILIISSSVTGDNTKGDEL